MIATLVMASACGKSPPVPTPELRAALESRAMGTPAPLGRASGWARDADSKAFVFGSREVMPAMAQAVRVGRAARLELDGRKSRARVAEATGPGEVVLTPVRGPSGFEGWGPGVASGDAVVYTSPDGRAAAVERAGAKGLKEDLVLSRPLGDALRFEWSLSLNDGFEPRLEADGSIAVRGPSHEVRFRLPAPEVRTASGDSRSDLARFELGERSGSAWSLALVAQGLSGLEYPVSLDPTVTVTTTADFKETGNLEANVVVGTDLVARQKTQAGSGAWSPTTASFITARYGHSAAVMNDVIYVTGGLTVATTLKDVRYGIINPDGNVTDFPTTTTLPSERSGHATVAYNRHLYVIGGLDLGSTQRAEVLVSAVDPAPAVTLGAFQATTPLKTARTDVAAVASNGFLYVTGGLDGTTMLTEVLVAPINADGTLGAFTVTTPFSTARRSHGAVVANGFLYIVGGDGGASGNLSDVQMAPIKGDGTLGAFTTTTALPGARREHATAVSNGSLFVFGGIDVFGAVGEVLAAPLRANGQLGPFAVQPSLPAPGRSDFAGVAANGHLYAIMGYGSSPLWDVQVAPVSGNGTTGFFNASPNMLPLPRRFHATATYGDFVYVSGGTSDGTTPLADLSYAPIDPLTGAVGTFTPTTALPAPGRFKHAMVAYESALYVLGGANGTAAPLGDVLRAVINSDGSLGPWTPVTNTFALPRSGLAAAVVGDRLYVVGGELAAGVMRNDVQVTTFYPVSGDTHPFSATASFVGPRAGHTVVVSGNTLYVAGGTDGVSNQGDVQFAPIAADGTLNPFTATSSFANPRAFHTSVTANDFLYVIGGQVIGVTGDIQVAPIFADGTLGAFASQALFPISARAGLTSFVANGSISVLGGVAVGNNSTSIVERAPLIAGGGVGAFVAEALPAARAQHAGAVSNGRVYLMGGQGASGRLDDVVVAAVNADGSVGPFASAGHFTTARDALTGLAYDNRLYVIGGTDGTTNFSDVQAAPIDFDGGVGAFVPAGAMPSGRNWASSAAWNGYLYVIGGYRFGALLEVLVAPINPSTGAVGTFTATSSLPTGRFGAAAVIYDGTLYVAGGNTGGSFLAEVVAAPINPSNGTLGAFAPTQPLPVPLGQGMAVATDGYLYFVGGVGRSYSNQVFAAPISSAGTLGAFVRATPLATPRAELTAAAVDGTLVVLGGHHGTGSLADLERAPLLTPTSRGEYSRVVDLGQPSTLVSLTVNGSPSRGTVAVSYRTAPPSGTFGNTVFRGTVPLGASLQLSGSNVQYVLVRLTLDDTRSAAVNADATTERDVTDFTVVANPDPTLTPAAPSVAPNGSVQFSCDGGSATPVTYTVTVQGSGLSTIDSAGLYKAGATANTTDVVTCTDSASSKTTATVTITAGASISPPSVSLAPRATQLFTPAGGSGAGFVFSMQASPSDGGITTGGSYTAGPVPNVTDVVLLTDSLGNTATASVSVGAGVSVSPASATLPPLGTQTFGASGGSGAGFSFTMQSAPSGGFIGPATHVYGAGPTGGVTDVVQVVDSLGNVGTASIAVGPGVSLSPANPSSPPKGSVSFGADGGSGTGFVYSLQSSPSGGSITSPGGVYTAGADGGVADVVMAVDSLGNVATTSVTVTAGVSLSPPSGSTTPKGSLSFSASGGSGAGYVFALQSPAPSGGTINSSTGAYTAGPTGSVTDVVKVTDPLGNEATANVTLSAGVSLTPGSASVTPKGSQSFSASGGSGTGFIYALQSAPSGGTIDPSTGAYTAGSNGSVTDVVKVTDSLGNVATASVSVTAGVSITPPSATQPPRGSVSFSALGGTGTGFVWSMQANPSGGAVDAASGAYVAGSTGNVTDVVKVSDSLGNVATASVTVTAPVTLTPASPTVPPRGPLSLSGHGGSGTGFAFSFVTNASGGSLDAVTGAYVAGTTPNVTDVVTAADSLGNTATLSILVGPAISIAPATLTVAPKESVTLVASGGQGSNFSWTLTTDASGGALGSTTGVYTAGATGGVSDVVTVTDPLGNSATLTIAVTAGVSVSPAGPSVPPKGSQSFSASGGKGTGFTFSLSPNNSGGSIGPTTGAYTAGATGGVSDVVQVTDSLGNVGTTNVTVTAAVSITPSSASLPPSQTLALQAAGGSGTGYSWAFTTNASGGTLDAATGAYKAGTSQAVDRVTVTDSLGNVATVDITVTTALSITPGSPSLPPRGTQVFTASGGSGTGFVWSLTVNHTGASFDPATQTYVAGPIPTGANPPDRVHVVDSLGNVKDADVTVTAGVSVSPATVTLPPKATRTFTASGGSGAGFSFALSTNGSGGAVGPGSGAYQAGADGGVTDVVTATDSLGNTGLATITVGPGVSLVASATSVTPKQALGVTVTATGGAGVPYTWSLAANASGGTVTDQGNGAAKYVPGATGSVSDVIQATDALGNVATLAIAVGPAVSVSASPAPPLAPQQVSLLSATGGSNTGYNWLLITNNSGGTLTSTTGIYTAGPTGGVTDVVKVIDSDANTATFSIQVLPSLAVTPTTARAVPKERLVFTATGGTGAGFTWSFSNNASQGSIDSTSGVYTAGAKGNVVDEIQVRDNVGSVAKATITVGPGLMVSPPTTTGPPGTRVSFTAQGGQTDGGYAWDFAPGGRLSGGAIDADAGTYVAGSQGSVTDVVQVTDALGNVGTATVTLTASLSIAPTGQATPPRGTVRLTASGGAGAPYVWSMASAPSGGAVDPSTGVYVAGPTGGKTDVVQVTDALMNVATVSVGVTAGITVVPATTSVERGGTAKFQASGGSSTGFAWSLQDAPSGGSIDASTGEYRAGTTGGVNDVILVTDSLGNTATAIASVASAGGVEKPVAEQEPLNGWSCGCGATDGSGTGLFGLAVAALLLRRRRPAAPKGPRSGALGPAGAGVAAALLVALVALPAGAAPAPAASLVVPFDEAAATVMEGLLEQLGKANVLAKGAGGRSKAVACLATTEPEAQRACLYEAARASNVLSICLLRTAPGKGKTREVTFEVLELSSKKSVFTQTVKSPEAQVRKSYAKVMPKLVASLKKLKREPESVAPAAPVAASAPPEPVKVPPVVASTPPVASAPPVTSPPPPPPAEPARRRSVAVFDVDVTIPNEKLDNAAFSEMLASAVDSLNAFRVVSSKEIATMVGIERQKQVLGCSDDTSCMAELASALGTDFVMVASVGRVGDNYLVSVKMIDGRHNRVAARASVQAKSANGLLEGIWRAAHQTLDAYGATLPAPEAAQWAARPKPSPPSTIVTADETPSHFGVTLGASSGYQPLSVEGKRGTVGGEVDLTWRRGRLDVAGGVVIAPSPGARVMAAWAVLDGRFRLDAGGRATVFPGLGRYGGGPTVGLELGLTSVFALQARGTLELYPAQGTVIVALLGAAGVAARF